jgi:CAAX prenyl protease-like protein
VAPFVVFLAAGALEPTASGDGIAGALGIPYAAYPLIYTLRLAATLAVLIWSWGPIRRWIGWPNGWPFLLGLMLVVPWIILATLQRELGWAGMAERSSFNPFAQWGDGGPVAWAFLAVRGFGLVVVVPIIEELFLRGFLMRYVINEEFWRVPFGKLTLASTAACLFYAVATHPAEAIAALSWFSVVSGIAAATRRPIDTILAHAGTNLALGAYVLATGNWWLV